MHIPRGVSKLGPYGFYTSFFQSFSSFPDESFDIGEAYTEDQFHRSIVGDFGRSFLALQVQGICLHFCWWHPFWSHWRRSPCCFCPVRFQISINILMYLFWDLTVLRLWSSFHLIALRCWNSFFYFFFYWLIDLGMGRLWMSILFEIKALESRKASPFLLMRIKGVRFSQ